MLTEDLRAASEKRLWDLVHQGQYDAVLAARELIARATSRQTKYVVRTRNAEFWLTDSGLGRHAADEAVVFETELKAEAAKSQYLKTGQSVSLIVVAVGA